MRGTKIKNIIAYVILGCLMFCFYFLMMYRTGWYDRYRNLGNETILELQKIRTEITARHGDPFAHDRKWHEFYKNQSWYKENRKFSLDMLTDNESMAVSRIQELEKHLAANLEENQKGKFLNRSTDLNVLKNAYIDSQNISERKSLVTEPAADQVDETSFERFLSLFQPIEPPIVIENRDFSVGGVDSIEKMYLERFIPEGTEFNGGGVAIGRIDKEKFTAMIYKLSYSGNERSDQYCLGIYEAGGRLIAARIIGTYTSDFDTEKRTRTTISKDLEISIEETVSGNFGGARTTSKRYQIDEDGNIIEKDQ